MKITFLKTSILGLCLLLSSSSAIMAQKKTLPSPTSPTTKEVPVDDEIYEEEYEDVEVIEAPTKPAPPQRPAKEMRPEKRKEMTPEQRAEKVTEKMTKNLGLNREQSEKVYSLNIEKGRQVQSIRSSRMHEEGKRERMKAIKKEYKTSLQQILTEEQFQKFKSLNKERKERRKAKRAKREDMRYKRN